MSKRRHKISSEIKSRILAEVLQPGSNIPKIAKIYGTSDGTIYRFIREAQKLTGNTNTYELKALAGAKATTSPSCTGKFIELSIRDSQNEATSLGSNAEVFGTSIIPSTVGSATTSSTPNHNIQKAYFVFDDFSIMLEGKIKTSNMLEIIKALDGMGESSC